MSVRMAKTNTTPGLPERIGAAAAMARDECDKGEHPTMTRMIRNGITK
jgi:hypothetical protein